MKKNLLLLVALFVYTVSPLLAQKQGQKAPKKVDFGMGAMVDAAKYEAIPIAAPTTTKGTDALPPIKTLKPYCPIPKSQGLTATGVAWASAYGARTIIHAIVNNMEDKQKITQEAFSPTFIHNQIAAQSGVDNLCNAGASAVDVLALMESEGVVKYMDFPFDEHCNDLPTVDHKQKASQYRIDGFDRLSYTGGDNTIVGKIRKSLSEDLPVVAVMRLPNNFAHDYHPDKIWDPYMGTDADKRIKGHHGMVVVGYDDENELFELMNSWGSDWNKDGFVYIAYEDMIDYTEECYHIIYSKAEAIVSQEATNIATAMLGEASKQLEMPEMNEGPKKRKDNDEHKVELNEFNLHAAVEFVQLATEEFEDGFSCVAGSNGVIKVGTMEAGNVGKSYKMVNANKAWTGYQMYIRTKANNMYVYGIGYDDTHATGLIFPYSNEALEAYYYPDAYKGFSHQRVRERIPYRAVYAVPHEDHCTLLDDNTGTIFCFLFSKNEIEIDEVMERVEAGTGDFQQRLSYALGERMADMEKVYFRNKSIEFSANLPSQAVVPLIVDMNHVD